MVRLSITPAAFTEIDSTLPLGSVGSEADPGEKGEWVICLEAVVVERIAALRGPGESFSDVILRARVRLRPSCDIMSTVNALVEW